MGIIRFIVLGLFIVMGRIWDVRERTSAAASLRRERMTRGRIRVVLLAIGLAVLPRGADAQVTFVVDSVRSGMWVEAEVATLFGSDADSDSTGLRGTFSLDVGERTVRITSGTLLFADSLRLKFRFATFTVGSITAVTEPSALSLEVAVPGPETDLIDGAFAQPQNILLFEGVLQLSGDGVFASVVPDAPQELAAGSTVTLAGTLAPEGGTYQLVLPIQFSGSFDLGSGSSAVIALDGTVWASGAVSSAVEDPAELPSELVVTDLYPQPARDRAKMVVSLAQSQQVQVEVFDVRGRRVTEPVEVYLGAGRSELSIDTSGLSSGFYVATVTGASRRDTVPFVVVR